MVKHEFEAYIGSKGQQNFHRTSFYKAFKFNNPSEIDPVIWRKYKDHPGFYIANKRSKAGKAMSEFLYNELERSSLWNLLELLSLDFINNTSFPYLHIADNCLILYLHDGYRFAHPDVVEITRSEFESILNSDS